MNCYRRLLLSIILISCAVAVGAQKMVVESFTAAPTDISASQYPRQDLTKNYCGLVKVQLAVEGVTFEGNVIHPVEHKVSEYWVYMTEGSKELKVNAPGYLPLHIRFGDYQINGIQPKSTYLLTLMVPQSGTTTNIDDGLRYLVLKVSPSNSSVYVDNQLQVVSDGVVSILLPQGNHTYRVESPGYATQTDEVVLGDTKRTLEITLSSVLATLTVRCPTVGANVWINDQLRGAVPWTGPLSAGNYAIEVRKEGYRSGRQTLQLSEQETRTVDIPMLTAITGNLNVNYQPADAEVFLDGQRLGTSPDVFRNLVVGRHQVEIRKSGYETKNLQVEISEGQTAQLSGTLNKGTNISASSSAASSSTQSFTVNGVSFTMIRVEGGTFTMGATTAQGSDVGVDEKPAHLVTLSSFYMGETEVTQALWQAVMGTNPSNFKGESLPVEQVSWDECQTFIGKLRNLTGMNFRLPTEAEWEFAARGGNKSKGYKYSGSNDIGSVAWYSDNSGGETHPVKTKSPNELGIYDMSGNVWEWCQDWYGSYGSALQTNPSGPISGSDRVDRGGSWHISDKSCRVSDRNWGQSTATYSGLGLRLAVNDYETARGGTQAKKDFNMVATLQSTPVIPSNTAAQTFTVKGVSFRMIRVKSGTFQMGSTTGDSDEKPVHQVTLSTYYIGETEVTQALWKAVMGTNPSDFKGENRPVERVSLNDCQTFIAKLNVLTGKSFRLPTEAEWEFAARGGNASRGYIYSGSNAASDVAWYNSNSNSMTHEVATKFPNELGIYDMSGNVSEWCQDRYGSYSSDAQTDPTGPSSGSRRVVRGGGWHYDDYGYCRVANRLWFTPSFSYADLGLRLAL